MAENLKANESTNAWLVESQELDLANGNSATGKKITLQTAGKWLDRNIEVAAPTAKISAGEITSGNVDITTIEVGEKTGSNYAISGNGTVAAPSVVTAGFISETEGTKNTGSATVTATIAAGEVAASVSATEAGAASMAAKGFTASETATAYEVDLSTVAGSATAKADVKTSGYMTAGVETETATPVQVAVSGDGSKLYIPEADVTAAASVVTAPTVSLSHEATVKTAASGDYKVTVSGTGAKGSAKAVAQTTGVGMVSATDAAENTVDVEVAEITDEVVYIQPATVGNAAKDADLTGYVENTSVVVPSEGYLTISEGYMPATKISLDQLLEGNPDAATAIAAGDMLQGAVAYNVDGVKITGTIPTVVPAVSAEDGQTVVVPKGYVAEETPVKVANGVVKANGAVEIANFEISPAAENQTITIEEGWLEDRTITIKGSSNLDPVKSVITADDAEATVSALTVGAANVAAATVAISGTGAISGTTSAKTSQAGYSALNAETGTGVISGTASVDATLPLFVGDYILG